MSPFCKTAGQESTALAPNSSSNAEQMHGPCSSAVQLLLVTLMLWDAGGTGGGVLVSAALTVGSGEASCCEAIFPGKDAV